MQLILLVEAPNIASRGRQQRMKLMYQANVKVEA